MVHLKDVDSGPVGGYVTLFGRGFGAGGGSVEFNGTPAGNVPVWTNTKIIAQVPAGATSGSLAVSVSSCGADAGTFTVRSGDIYFVDSGGGDDGNPGTESSPWRTLRHSASSMSSGDVLLIRGGTYAENDGRYGFEPTLSGTASRPILFRSFPGETARITVGGSDKSHSVRLAGDHLVLSGVEITGSGGQGVSMYGDQNTLFDCDIFENHMSAEHSQTGSGVNIHINSTGSKVYASKIRDNGSQSNLDHGFYVKGTSVDIAWNDIYGNYSYGAQLYQGSADPYRDLTVRNNVFRDNGSAGLIVATGAEDVYVFNNIFHGNAGAGFRMNYAPITNVEIYNNTSYENGTWEYDLREGSGVTFRNNIAYSSSRQALRVDSSVSGFTSDFNVYGPGSVRFEWRGSTYTGLASFRNASGQGASSVEGDPLLRNPAAGDYRIEEGSPARDMATSQGAPTSDREGVPRPTGPAVDAGCHEYETAAPNEPPPPVSNLRRSDTKN
jgi:hypothetical protein